MSKTRPLGLAAALVALFVTAALFLPHSPAALRDLIHGYGAAAPLIAVAAWALLTPVLFPGTVLALACGLAFGGVAGGALAMAGAVLGGLAAFGLARTAARARVERFVKQKARLRRGSEVLERQGFPAVLAARLMPGVPATWLHYVAGVSPVRARSFAAAIALGALLRTVPYAFLGQSLASGSALTLLFAAGSIGIGGLTAALVTRRLRSAGHAPA